MNDDLISRQAAIDIFDDYNIAVENGEIESYRRYREQLSCLPSVQPKTGQWIDDCGGVKCSCCGYYIDDNYYAKNYCTNCGAKMGETENG